MHGHVHRNRGLHLLWRSSERRLRASTGLDDLHPFHATAADAARSINGYLIADGNSINLRRGRARDKGSRQLTTSIGVS
jgi:hypothetical protein